jgi:predicted alternative tryptophan synthase beta-subunit
LSISELKINKKEFYLKSLSKDQGVVACYWIDFNDSTISPLLKMYFVGYIYRNKVIIKIN